MLSQVKQFLNCVQTAFVRSVTVTDWNLDGRREKLWHNSWSLIDVQLSPSSNENSIYLVKFVFPPFTHPISTIPAFKTSESIFDDSNELFSLCRWTGRFHWEANLNSSATISGQDTWISKLIRKLSFNSIKFSSFCRLQSENDIWNWAFLKSKLNFFKFSLASEINYAIRFEFYEHKGVRELLIE